MCAQQNSLHPLESASLTAQCSICAALQQTKQQHSCNDAVKACPHEQERLLMSPEMMQPAHNEPLPCIKACWEVGVAVLCCGRWPDDVYWNGLEWL